MRSRLPSPGQLLASPILRPFDGSLLLAAVFEHLATGLFALAAFVGAHLHVLVVGERGARLAAAGAGLGARFTDQVGERPLACHDAGGGRAVRRAVLAGGEGFLVLLLAVSEHFGTVGGAGITS